MSAELDDRFNDGYRAAEAHWRKRWYAANADHQAAVTENEHLRADLIRVNVEYHGLLSDVEAERDAALARLAAVEALVVDGEASDGHHTHNELYEYRMLYNAHAAHGWRAAGIRVVKSWRHSDGEECFGGGWFIVVATLPTGQVSNHYKAEHWGLFQVPEVDLPPEYDGHTPADAAARLRAALAAAPTDTTKEN